MRAALGILVVAVLGQAAGPARAEFFGIELPELIGTAPVYGGPAIEVPFDFGQGFEHVENVIVMIEATTTPLVVLSCGGVTPVCSRLAVNLGFLAQLDGPDLNHTTALVEGFRPDLPTKQAGVFGKLFLDFSFDHLTDGSGTLRVWWNQVLFAHDTSRAGATGSADIDNAILVPGDGSLSPGIEPPTGTITDAVLIVEATPLPEPIVDCPRRWPGCWDRGWPGRGLGPPGR